VRLVLSTSEAREERGCKCHPLEGGFLPGPRITRRGRVRGALGTHLGWILGLVGTRASGLRGLSRPGKVDAPLRWSKCPSLGPEKAQILVSKRVSVQFTGGERSRTQGWMEFPSASHHAHHGLKFFELGCQPFISSPGVRVLASQGTMPRENGVTPDGEDKESTDFRRKLRGKMRNLHKTLHGASP